MTTQTITEFIAARLRDDEEAAHAALEPDRAGTHWEWVEQDDAPAVAEKGELTMVDLRTVERKVTRNLGAIPGFVIDTAQWVSEGASAHIARHDPARVLREVETKRRVLDRHCRYDDSGHVDYCAGCPSGDDAGYPDTELDDCPELQDIAYIWNEHGNWNQKWCPHLEGRHEADVTEVPPARGCYTNACNRCGQGDGWHYRNRRTT